MLMRCAFCIGLIASLVACKAPTPTPVAGEPVDTPVATSATGRVLTVQKTCDRAPGCYATIGEAMSAAHAGDTIAVAAGTYSESVTFAQPNVALRGGGMPAYKDGKLSGGTIVIGTINCNSQVGATVADLGVVASPSSANAVISGKPGSGKALQQTFENLALLGGGYAERTHGLLCNSGSGLTVRNLRLYRWYHGLAIKCSDATVDGVYAFECAGNSIIVKSDKATGDAIGISIQDVTIEGSPRGQQWGGSIHLQSAAAQFVTSDVTISDVVAHYASKGVILIDRLNDLGAVSAITVTHVTSDRAGDTNKCADYDISAATDVTLQDCSSTSTRGYAFRTRDGAQGVAVIGAQVDDAGVAEYEGEFEHLEINRVTISD
jgi:hypothetical protein